MSRGLWPGLDAKEGRVWLAVDAAAILALGVVLTIVLLPSYGNGWLWVAALGGTLLGMGVALFGAMRRLNAALVALVGIAAYFVFGSVLAMPDSAIGYVIPNLRTLRGLATGPVTAWKAMLTVDPPLGTTWNLMTVPLLLAFVPAIIALSLSLRTSRPQLAWLPQTAAAVFAFALGVNYSVAPLPLALAWSALVLIWTTYRRRHLRSALVQSQHLVRIPAIAVGAIVIGVAGAVTAASYPVLTSDAPRDVLRRVVEQPLDLRNYPSPLQGFRANLTTNDSTVLFTVEGATSGSIVRVATMDAYDGLTYNVTNDASGESDAGMFRRVGSRINTTTAGDPVEATVTIGALRGPWVPFVGQATDIAFTSDRKVALTDTYFHNVASGTGVVTAGLTTGDSYTFTSVVPRQRTDAEIRGAHSGTFRLPIPVEVPDRLRDDAVAFTSGSQTRGEAARRIESRLRQGYFSNGIGEQTLSLPGHSYSRLNDLLADPMQMVGDHEQYAVVMALMARDLDIPARVVYGYELPGGSGEVRGRDVGAWTELYLDQLGWVLFDPTPPKDRVLTNPTPPEPPELRPHVDTPPPPPERPDVPPPDNDLEPNPVPPPPPPPTIDIRKVLTYTAVIGLPLLIFVGIPVLILGLKSRRRRTRQNDPDVALRFAGGWAELLDRARDLARTPSPTATRSEQAAILASDFDHLAEHADPMLLARQADAAVFAPDPVTEDQASSFWRGIEGAVQGLQESVSSRKWLASRLSTRSFRRFR